MWNVTVKYVSPAPRSGNLTYRRRVPKVLRDRVGRSEFIKVLGKTQADALLEYSKFHRHVEHLIALAKGGVTGMSPSEQRDRLTALLTERGADPYSSGLDDSERTWRGKVAEQLVSRYQDQDTGDYGARSRPFSGYVKETSQGEKMDKAARRMGAAVS